MAVTTASGEDRPQRSGWGRKLKFALGGLMLALPVAIGWTFQPPEDVLEQLLRDYEFVPIKLPSKNFIPGSIVEVNQSGRIKNTVCVPPADLLGIVQDSPTPALMRSQLSSSNFALGAKVIDRINQSLSSDAVQAVTLEFNDVKVREIAGSDLTSIRDALLRQPKCLQAVTELLQAGRFVCLSSALFEATVSYRVAYKSRLAGASEIADGVLEVAVKQAALGAKISSIDHQPDAAKDKGLAQSSGDSSLEFRQVSIGENLNYGMRIYPLCLTFDNGKSMQLPSSEIEKFVVWIREELTFI